MKKKSGVPSTARPAQTPEATELSVCVFGAASDTANLGVAALGQSIVHAFKKSSPRAKITVFDFSRGVSASQIGPSDCKNSVLRCGGYHTKHIYRSESLWNIGFCSRFGGLWNPGSRLFRAADAVLDVTGGDSFTDLYGAWRFNAGCIPKQMALDFNKSLILLPQTFGPFQSTRNRRMAARIVRSAAMAWARDDRSFAILQELLEEHYDPALHRSGVDVAFGLPTVVPTERALGTAAPWLQDKSTPLVGLNVSGLLMNRPKAGIKHFGIRADYEQVLVALTNGLLSNSNARILLVPHVVNLPGHYESDIEAGTRLAALLGDEAVGRVMLLPALHDPCEVKYAISQCDWFCGTRMHSTIAALSSGVPTAAIAYSPKTLGVFETCGQGAHVADPRTLDTEEMVGHLWKSWLTRDEAQVLLSLALPGVLRCAEEQMDAIVAECVKRAAARQKDTLAR